MISLANPKVEIKVLHFLLLSMTLKWSCASASHGGETQRLEDDKLD